MLYPSESVLFEGQWGAHNPEAVAVVVVMDMACVGTQAVLDFRKVLAFSRAIIIEPSCVPSVYMCDFRVTVSGD